MKVRISSPSLGPITVTAVHLRPAAAGVDSHPWMQHELVFRNDGDRPAHFADTRTARLLGRPSRLLVGEEGCGYARATPDAQVTGACLTYLDPFTVGPHSTVSRTVTLYKELTGMRPLAPGTYVFNRPVRFALGSAAPEPGAGRAFTLKVRYVVSRS